jgi:anti-sigma regulatory factor (Ser/Thr protein kinase)
MADISTVSRTFIAEQNRISEIREFFDETLNGCVPVQLLTTFKLIADEILANVSAYAYDDNIDKWLEVSISMNDGVALISFADGGRPFDPMSAPEPNTDLSVEERELGGLGLFIVKNLADETSYSREDGRNILTIKKKI